MQIINRFDACKALALWEFHKKCFNIGIMFLVLGLAFLQKMF